ncbi:MAG: ABC transporter ATP-binding protein [Deltaproteobacteria bacterium]|nr:MAG: ABC transporter ATP-binding protein [Deltaproteobacteria bacterium]
MKPAIEVHQLTRTFGRIKAVDRVAFDVYPGEVFGFLGPNGAGKTTTVRMLTGVIDPSDGTAVIQGHDIRRAPLRSRAHIAVVPEEANVYLDLTVWQNIMLMAELHGIPRRQRTGKADQLLDALGIADRKKQKARMLSKGLRQRLMLCAALVTDPEIIFLDEPTSGLDVESARLMRQIVADLNKDGLTVFLTTHNMTEAGDMCARVAIINSGRIAAIDTPENLRAAISSRQYVEVAFSMDLPDQDQLETITGVFEMKPALRRFTLYTDTPGQVAAEVVRWADQKGHQIAGISIHKPSLEDVYLHFTRTRRAGGSQ